jgi:hypothetical protein
MYSFLSEIMKRSGRFVVDTLYSVVLFILNANWVSTSLIARPRSSFTSAVQRMFILYFKSTAKI